MQGDIVSDKRVKVDLLKLIHRLFDCIDGSCDTFLLAVESTECTLCLQGLLNKADDVLGLLLFIQFLLFIAKAAAPEQNIHV